VGVPGSGWEEKERYKPSELVGIQVSWRHTLTTLAGCGARMNPILHEAQ
jgi:hypothetical protein